MHTVALPALEVRDAGEKGRGAFALEKIKPGQIVLIFTGDPIGFDEIVDPERTLQISEDQVISTTGKIDDFVNHCCEPNTGLQLVGKSPRLIALREIQIGEELSFDYSTSTNLGDNWTMKCFCDAPNCRKIIRDYDFLPENVKQKYLELKVVPHYVLKKRSEPIQAATR